ncbi:poly(ADP-ribose) glycohydrolase 1-like isoform X2 [Wolffia australiana]
MENRQDLQSILPLLPLSQASSELFWPPNAVDCLNSLSMGPSISKIDSGTVLFHAIVRLRASLGLSEEGLASNAAHGYAFYFDELMFPERARRWFADVVPFLARLLLSLPSLLEVHYRDSDRAFGSGNAGLRVLYPQEAGIVFLSQELIAAFLACSLFCAFPQRHGYDLPVINFDDLFGSPGSGLPKGYCQSGYTTAKKWRMLPPDATSSQRGKIDCLVHYFERVSSSVPTGVVSFRRKVLAFRYADELSYPDVDFWRQSNTALCSFRVSLSGCIEDQQYEILEVDFANKCFGGGALRRGCVQEEICFMLNPELIAGMFFLPPMENNETIEVIGAERFSDYKGYSSTFHFAKNHNDTRPLDYLKRKKRMIVAIDALCRPGVNQFKTGFLVRETNKAFCGFQVQSHHNPYLKQKSGAEVIHPSCTNLPDEVLGVATGNWGCGAFGGDLEIKSMIQWLAASQAGRPFILYNTFGVKALQRLEEVTQFLLENGWTVGDLWTLLDEYGAQRYSGETYIGFLDWLVPSPHLGIH